MSNNNNEERILQGVYNGMTRKIDELKESMKKELQYTAAQQSSANQAVVNTWLP